MRKTKDYKDDLDRMLTLSEASELLGVSKSTIRRLSNIGEIKSFRVGTGKHRRFKKSELIEYLERNSV